jgi:hypothetical protein
MKHYGLSAPPEDLFGYAAANACIDICQAFIDIIQADPKTPEGRTGHLKTGWHIVEQDGGGLVVNPQAPYWPFVEYGHDIVDDDGNVTGHVHKRPFARPAWKIVKRRARHGDMHA